MFDASFAGKRLMIIGAARGQLGLYKEAKSLGIKTIAAGKLGNYPGLKFADVVCPVDILSPENVLNAAVDQRVDAVATCCADTGIESLGFVNDALGLPGVCFEAAKRAGNKKLLREALEGAGVPIAGGEVVTSVDVAKKVIDELGLPVVIKRFSSQGSSGVFVEKTKEEASARVADIISIDGECLIEEYLKGEEFGAQAFVYNGEVLFVAPHRDILYIGNAPMPVGHWLPFSAAEDKNEKVRSMVEAAIKAVGFDNCAVNVDLKEDGDDLRLIELTGRAGANGLPELMGALFGHNYYRDIISASFGIEPSFTPVLRDETVVVKMVMPAKAGIMRTFDGTAVSDNVIETRPFIENGARYDAFSSLRDCIGQILVKGADYAQCEETFNMQAKLSFCLDRDDLI